MKIFPVIAISLLLIANPCVALDVEYSDGDTPLQGFVVLPEKRDGKLPAVIIVHDWMGLGEYSKMRAAQIAELGYVAFAADIYGKGVRPEDKDAAAAQAGKYRGDIALFHSRLQAALKQVQSMPEVDSSKIAAIGYCFGGGAVLEMARMGADVTGVVSFHGNLGTPNPVKKGALKASVLVLHGAEDPHVSAGEKMAFEDEMRKADADWQFVSFGNAVHSFSNKKAGNDTASGNAYDAAADKRSWEYMKIFLAEVLGD